MGFVFLSGCNNANITRLQNVSSESASLQPHRALEIHDETTPATSATNSSCVKMSDFVGRWQTSCENALRIQMNFTSATYEIIYNFYVAADCSGALKGSKTDPGTYSLRSRTIFDPTQCIPPSLITDSRFALTFIGSNVPTAMYVNALFSADHNTLNLTTADPALTSSIGPASGNIGYTPLKLLRIP
jgi:hypothetical protein